MKCVAKLISSTTVPTLAILSVLQRVKDKDDGGAIYEMMDWDSPEHCFARWHAMAAASKEKKG